MMTVVQCGDMNLLSQLEPSLSALPLVSERLWNRRTIDISNSIVNALTERYRDKTVLVVVDVTHLGSVNGQPGLLTRLQQAHIQVARVSASEELSCPSSTFTEKGAAQRHECLLPPGEEQPPSCRHFGAEFARVLSQVKENRTSDIVKCDPCQNSDTACVCEVNWFGDDQFRDLCTTTPVDGVKGAVYYVDGTRNFGSLRTGPGLAEKTIKGLEQKCFATSCDVGILEREQLRLWYASDPQLASGFITLRCTGANCPRSQQWHESLRIPGWFWLLLAAALVSLVVGVVWALHVLPKYRERKRNFSRQVVDEHDEAEEELEEEQDTRKPKVSFSRDPLDVERSAPPSTQPFKLQQHGSLSSGASSNGLLGDMYHFGKTAEATSFSSPGPSYGAPPQSSGWMASFGTPQGYQYTAGRLLESPSPYAVSEPSQAHSFFAPPAGGYRFT